MTRTVGSDAWAWTVIRVWEHETPSVAAERVTEALRLSKASTEPCQLGLSAASGRPDSARIVRRRLRRVSKRSGYARLRCYMCRFWSKSAQTSVRPMPDLGELRSLRGDHGEEGRRRKTAEEVRAAEAQIADQTKRIEFYITEYSVEILANKVRSGDYVVPQYQRAFTWEPQRKSKFIESLIMGLPIPFLFFWEMPSGQLEIVDGSQRLRTIEEFVLGNLKLGNLDQLTDASGFTFKDLPESRRKKILNRSIRGIVLNENADEAARLDMFERINTGSKIPNPAEVRRGALAGPFLDLVMELSNDSLFEQLAPMSDPSAKGARTRRIDHKILRLR